MLRARLHKARWMVIAALTIIVSACSDDPAAPDNNAPMYGAVKKEKDKVNKGGISPMQECTEETCNETGSGGFTIGTSEYEAFIVEYNEVSAALAALPEYEVPAEGSPESQFYVTTKPLCLVQLSRYLAHTFAGAAALTIAWELKWVNRTGSLAALAAAYNEWWSAYQMLPEIERCRNGG